MNEDRDRPLVWLHGEVKTPPFSAAARVEAGVFLRRLQRGDRVGLPHSRPMPSIGARCHELRIQDERRSWRVVYRSDPDAIVIAAVFAKSTRHTPHEIIVESRRRLGRYDAAVQEGDGG